jgi:hypothetical protein
VTVSCKCVCMPLATVLAPKHIRLTEIRASFMDTAFRWLSTSEEQSTLLDLINGPHLNCVMLPNSGGTWLILLLAKSNVASLLSWESPATSIRVKQLS